MQNQEKLGNIQQKNVQTSITPHPFTYEAVNSLRSKSKPLKHMICELLDNSLDAEADEFHVNIIGDSEKKNSNVLVHLDSELKRVREKVIEFDFAWLEIQGRGVKGSTLTAHKVDRVVNAPRENGDENVESVEQEKSKSEPVKAATKKEDAQVKKPEAVSAKPPPEKPKASEPTDQKLKDQATFDFEGR